MEIPIFPGKITIFPMDPMGFGPSPRSPQDGTVRFWEPFLGSGTLQLRRRFAHPQFLLPGKRLDEVTESLVD